MVAVLMVLTVANTAVAVAALVLSVMLVATRRATNSRACVDAEEAEPEERSFKLDDKKMQEGIANLLGYQPRDRSDEE